MNKYQEALDYLAVSLQVFDETVDDKPYRDELDSKRETARKELQGLVDKATPKKPDFWGDGYGDEYWNCPCCGASFETDYDKYDYCPECGQAIDWSE